MNKDWFKCTVAILDHYELTLEERQFVEGVKEYFEKKGMLTQQQELILKAMHTEKIIWGKMTTQQEQHIQG
jgi:hypothetical protein